MVFIDTRVGGLKMHVIGFLGEFEGCGEFAGMALVGSMVG